MAHGQELYAATTGDLIDFLSRPGLACLLARCVRLLFCFAPKSGSRACQTCLALSGAPASQAAVRALSCTLPSVCGGCVRCKVGPLHPHRRSDLAPGLDLPSSPSSAVATPRPKMVALSPPPPATAALMGALVVLSLLCWQGEFLFSKLALVPGK